MRFFFFIGPRVMGKRSVSLSPRGFSVPSRTASAISSEKRNT
jgi:hypothetical protein